MFTALQQTSLFKICFVLCVEKDHSNPRSEDFFKRHNERQSSTTVGLMLIETPSTVFLSDLSTQLQCQTLKMQRYGHGSSDAQWSFVHLIMLNIAMIKALISKLDFDLFYLC